MRQSIRAITIVIVAASGSIPVSAQHPPMPPGMTHEAHLKQIQEEGELKRRGQAAMGFDQDKASHHFLLRPEGGTIQVEAKEADDAETRELIRAHLRQIATDFASGDFHLPIATHAEIPSGAAAMQEQKASITYVFEETGNGGRVRIAASNAAALSAVHDFLRYQIREHHTGDPVTVQK